jgi:hypothetical protein
MRCWKPSRRTAALLDRGRDEASATDASHRSWAQQNICHARSTYLTVQSERAAQRVLTPLRLTRGNYRRHIATFPRYPSRKPSNLPLGHVQTLLTRGCDDKT